MDQVPACVEALSQVEKNIRDAIIKERDVQWKAALDYQRNLLTTTDRNDHLSLCKKCGYVFQDDYTVCCWCVTVCGLCALQDPRFTWIGPERWRCTVCGHNDEVIAPPSPPKIPS